MRKKGITDDNRMNLAFSVFIFLFVSLFVYTFWGPLDIQGTNTETKYVVS